MAETRDRQTGKAGVDYVSNSSLSTFRGCSHRFNLHYNKNIRAIKTGISLYFGSMLHDALHVHYSAGMSVEETKTYFESAFRGGLKTTPILWAGDGKVKILKNGTVSKARNDFGDADSAIDYGKRCLDAYFNAYPDGSLEVLASEVKFEFPLTIPGVNWNHQTDSVEDDETIIVMGYIDKIVRLDGKIYVLDYKTAAQREDEEYLQVENQVSTYYLGAKVLGYDIDGALFDYIYKTKDPEVARYYTSRTPEQIEDWMEQARNTVRAMRQGIVYKNISKMGCKNCDLRQYCWKGEQLGDTYFIKESKETKEVEDEI